MNFFASCNNVLLVILATPTGFEPVTHGLWGQMKDSNLRYFPQAWERPSHNSTLSATWDSNPEPTPLALNVRIELNLLQTCIQQKGVALPLRQWLIFGALGRARSCNLRLIKTLLYQLSYQNIWQWVLDSNQNLAIISRRLLTFELTHHIFANTEPHLLTLATLIHCGFPLILNCRYYIT